MNKTLPPGKSIDLDALFRRDSGARKIAERLLTGEPVTRQDLSSYANLSVTSVNRVIQSLENAGATVRRDIAEDGRQARFHLTSIGAPKVDKPFPALNARARFVRGELMGEALMLDFVADDVRYRGALAQMQSASNLIGHYVTVVGVNLEPAGGASVTLQDDEASYSLGGVHIVA